PDRLHAGLADFVPDRRADSPAVHERRHRPPVQRVRHYPGGGHIAVAGHIAYAHAHDVRAAAAPRGRTAARALPALAGPRDGSPGGRLRAGPWLGAEPPAAYPVGGGGHTLAYRRPVRPW